MFEYRRFFNSDPPSLVTIWNECFGNRGAYPLRHPSVLEAYLFNKPYFDPHGLIIATHDHVPIGFTLAGFGANAECDGLDTTLGVIFIVAVHPSYRNHGIGSELLGYAEDYLRSRGAMTIYAGSMSPACPFGFGLYGGSDCPGLLLSDPDAAPFLEINGYQGERSRIVFQRPLDRPLAVIDSRFTQLRRRFTLERIPEAPVGTWWEESVLGPVDPVELRLFDTTTDEPVAGARLWEMEGFSWRWGKPSVGLIDIHVDPDLRGQGLAKLLLTQTLKFLQDQFFGLVEAQAAERDAASVGLLRSLGFEQVDVGRVYRKRDIR